MQQPTLCEKYMGGKQEVEVMGCRVLLLDMVDNIE